MKTLLLLALLALPLKAVNVTLEWDKPPVDEAALIAGTRLYERKPDGTTARIGAVQGAQNSEITIDFAEGRHTVFATFFTPEGLESPPSEDLLFTVPKKPGKPRVKIALQATTELSSSWQTVAFVEKEAAQHEFFRVQITPMP